MFRNGALTNKIDYILIFFFDVLNLEGYQNCITGSRVMAIFLNRFFLLNKVVKLVGGGFVINRAYPV